MHTKLSSPVPIKKSDHPLRFSLRVELDDDRPIYLSGDFNNWELEDEKFKLSRVGAREYEFAWPDDLEVPQQVEYKYLKGGWDSVEIDRYGNRIENRHISRPVGEICDVVSRWRLKGAAYNQKFLTILDVIKEDYEIPQLGKHRRICALLPYDYEDTDKDYPVLYMNDGQNLFDDTGPYGNWAIDQKLAILAEYGYKDLIVITIDHGEEDRITEYSPFFNWRWGKGDGNLYLKFVTETLKPYVDKHYRTLSDRLNTGIGGSSMGGLISLYSGLRYPQVFGKLLVFSPSLWITPKIFLKRLIQPMITPWMFIYMPGEMRVRPCWPRLINLKNTLKNHPEIVVRTSIDPQGKHNEFKWGQEFPQAAEWLFFKKD